MSKGASSSAVDSEILPNGASAVDSPMRSVRPYAAASLMPPRVVDESMETVSVVTDWYAPHLESRTADEIVADLIERYRAGLPRNPFHLMPLHFFFLPGGTTATVPLSDSSHHSDLSLAWRRTHTMPSETSSDSDDETDPEMPVLIDDSTLRAEYVAHRFCINGQVIPMPRTSEELQGVAGDELEGIEGLD